MLYSRWLQLPVQTRHALAQAFHITKKNPTHVVDNVVRDDGYPIGDVERALSIPAMQEYVQTASNSEELLWESVVAKAEGRTIVVSQTIDIPAVIVEQTIIETSPGPKPKAKKTVAKKIKK